MKVLFDKKFLYNWTVNPDRPGLADFLVFSLKYACIALLVYSLQIDRWLEFTVGILAPLLEEQARVTWMHNAKSPLRAGMIFAVLLAAAELLELGRISGGFATLSGFSELIAVRSVPSLSHVLDSLLVYVLLRRKINVVAVWLGVSLAHFLYNELLAQTITEFMKSLVSP